jgi:hypothetical protein
MAARAQRADLWAFDQNDPVRKSFGTAFMQGLAELGWPEGRNLRGIEWFDFAGGL